MTSTILFTPWLTLPIYVQSTNGKLPPQLQQAHEAIYEQARTECSACGGAQRRSRDAQVYHWRESRPFLRA